jgi:Ni/Fe-hydrogenase subunit HybB-like protein
MAYMIVLWIELGPAFLERWKEQDRYPRLRRFSQRLYPKLNKALLWIIALGMLLPTMHQSSLGSLMMLSGGHLHSLWFTPLLPLLFLISCIGMGYGVVVMESSLSSTFFHRERETKMLGSLSGAMVIVLGLFVVIRFVDLVARGVLPLAFQATGYAAWFWLEMLLVLVPLGMLMVKAKRRRPGYLFTAALLLVFGGAVYRFITYLVAFNPGDNWSYFPSAPEVLITVGLVALEIAVYIYLVKRFPILSGTRRPHRPAEVST